MFLKTSNKNRQFHIDIDMKWAAIEGIRLRNETEVTCHCSEENCEIGSHSPCWGDCDRRKNFFFQACLKAQEKWYSQGAEEAKGVETTLLQLQGKARSPVPVTPLVFP